MQNPPADAKAPRATLALVLPMVVFMAFTAAGGAWPSFYAASYILKTLIVGGLLIFFWRRYTDIRWTHLGLGFAVGVIGIVQWVGMETLLMHWPVLWWSRTIGDIQHAAFRPYEYFHSPLTLWGFIAIRWLGPTLVVPVMEELFWRDYLWRSIASPNDYRLQALGEYDPAAFWITVAAFASVHPQWLTAAVWGAMIGWLLWRTRSLGACIVAHATTNFLLGAYVLVSWYGFGRDQWFFW